MSGRPTHTVFDSVAFIRAVMAYAKRHRSAGTSSAQFVANETGVSRATVYNVLRGHNAITLRAACVLAAWADLSLDDYVRTMEGVA